MSYPSITVAYQETSILASVTTCELKTPNVGNKSLAFGYTVSDEVDRDLVQATKALDKALGVIIMRKCNRANPGGTVNLMELALKIQQASPVTIQEISIVADNKTLCPHEMNITYGKGFDTQVFHHKWPHLLGDGELSRDPTGAAEQLMEAASASPRAAVIAVVNQKYGYNSVSMGVYPNDCPGDDPDAIHLSVEAAAAETILRREGLHHGVEAMNVLADMNIMRLLPKTSALVVWRHYSDASAYAKSVKFEVLPRRRVAGWIKELKPIGDSVTS
jgi:hypothetical protein